MTLIDDKDSDGILRLYKLSVSYLEIYNEKIYDLLSNDRDRQDLSKSLREDPKTKTFHVDGLTDVLVTDADALRRVIEDGNRRRSVAATQWNQGSSRSHSLLTLSLKGDESSATGRSGSNSLSAKLNLVDLAGSEKYDIGGAAGIQKECRFINTSLSSLTAVIQGLSTGQQHIRYRDSVLTKLLQDSLGGAAKTCMICCLNPEAKHMEQTVNTLRYASLAKNVINHPTVNTQVDDTSATEFRFLHSQIDELK
jgi:hypothetical protein